MSRDPVRIALAALAGSSLFILYFLFLVILLPSLNISDELEQVILVTMILRLIAVASIPKVRNSPPQLKISIFSLEIFFIAALIIAYFVTGEMFYDVSMGTVLTVWVGTVALVLTPYFVVWFAYTLYKTSSLFSIFWTVPFEFANVVFLVNLISSGSVPTSLAALGGDIINSVVGLLKSRPPSLFSYSQEILASTAILFVALLLYATVIDPSEGRTIRNYAALVFPLIGTLFLGLWIFVLLYFSNDILFIFTVPSCILATGLWWFTRHG